ncbi:MAG TPA: His/Gly/Thr/Pro-type tRNA ligase C-terminal domain-containing protein, partial [Bacillota bacterium]|nr:His/Gly/Thr/Pro-type tRNA ligase C-terminal domain-containing protein [Bacillota bacterium]
GGPSTPGIGFAAGVERLLMVLQARNLIPVLSNQPHLYLAPLGEKAQLSVFSLAIRLREAGWRVESDLQGRSLKAQMKSADKLGARLVGVVGDDELANHQVLIRRMDASQQETIDLDRIEEYLEQVYNSK